METKYRKSASARSDGRVRLVIIFTAVFLGVVLLFGMTLGTVAIVRNSTSYLSYRGVSINKGVANYLAMMAKYNYMSALSASGTPSYDDEYFWQSESESGETYGALLQTECDAYIKSVLVGTYFFDKNAKLTSDDKQSIEDAVNAIVGNFADRDAFDTEAETRGFKLRDVRRAVEMIYKYTLAKTVIFGYDGEALKSGEFDSVLDEFYASYSYAKLLFIRTEDKYVTDPDTGRVDLVELDEVERELLNDKIARIRYLISGEGEEIMSENSFDYYINEFSSDEMNRKSGYYLSSASSHSRELNKVYPEVVRAVLSAKEETYTEVETQYGVCFIYKTSLPLRGYIYPSNDSFFTDFYSLAAGYIYSSEILSYSSDVKVKNAYLEIDFLNTYCDYRLAVRF